MHTNQTTLNTVTACAAAEQPTAARLSESKRDNSTAPVRLSSESPVERVAITPKEFAAKFGKSVTWTYRRIYAGEIKVLGGFRPRLIPLAEVQRFLERAARFNGRA